MVLQNQQQNFVAQDNGIYSRGTTFSDLINANDAVLMAKYENQLQSRINNVMRLNPLHYE